VRLAAAICSLKRKRADGAQRARSCVGPRRRRVALFLLLVLLALVVGALGWCRWVYCRLRTTPAQDQAAPSDAIAVLGAAEYDGKPSPVYRARLDHALELYQRGIAPLIITLGGNGGDQYTEGAWAAST
jgi:vancomycin permeability regulator SanA